MELIVSKCIIDKSTVDSAATSHTRPVFSLSGAEYLFKIMARVTTAFAGVTYPEVRIGYADDLERFVPRQAINRVGDLVSGAGSWSDAYCQKQHIDHVKTEVQKTIIATFSSTAGNFSSLSAGTLEVVLLYAK